MFRNTCDIVLSQDITLEVNHIEAQNVEYRASSLVTCECDNCYSNRMSILRKNRKGCDTVCALSIKHKNVKTIIIFISLFSTT